MKQYRIYCETEAAYVKTWAQDTPTECPNNPGHTITPSKTCITDDCYCKRAQKINDQTGTSYTLAYDDAYGYVRCTNAAAIAVTVPPDVFPIGCDILVGQGGAGQITLTEGSGVTINGDKKTTGINKGCALIQVAENVWDVHGSLEA